MPVLLPDRFLRPERSLLICTTKTRAVAERLRRLLPHAAVEETDAYDLPAIPARLNSLVPADRSTVVNLTGDTKMMMLAAFALAMQRGWDCVYLESERPCVPGLRAEHWGHKQIHCILTVRQPLPRTPSGIGAGKY